MVWAIKIGLWLLGLLIPALKPSPEREAQAQKDRADNAEALLKAKIEGDKIENSISAGVAADPGKLRQHDKFEL